MRTKLSVVTLLLPKLHSKPGLITKESDDEADSGNEANSIDGSAIDHVAAAQKLTAAAEQSSSCRRGFGKDRQSSHPFVTHGEAKRRR